MVAIPQAVDQFANAARIADLGVGRVLPCEGIDANTLRDAVAELTVDASVTARLAVLRVELRETGGAQRAADAVESVLGSTR